MTGGYTLDCSNASPYANPEGLERYGDAASAQEIALGARNEAADTATAAAASVGRERRYPLAHAKALATQLNADASHGWRYFVEAFADGRAAVWIRDRDGDFVSYV